MGPVSAGALVAGALGKAAVAGALARPLRLPLLVLHGGAIVATHVVAGALLGGMGVAVAALAARAAVRRDHHRR